VGQPQLGLGQSSKDLKWKATQARALLSGSLGEIILFFHLPKLMRLVNNKNNINVMMYIIKQ
jgi:hypothetical protein